MKTKHGQRANSSLHHLLAILKYILIFFKKTIFTFAPTEIELSQKPFPITNQQSTVLNFDFLVISFKKRYP